jgi:hypothetical protein
MLMLLKGDDDFDRDDDDAAAAAAAADGEPCIDIRIFLLLCWNSILSKWF